MFAVALLGHMRLAFDGQPIEFGAPRKTLPILAYLLLHRTGGVARDFVAFTMWPDAEEEAARGNLRRNLSLLKTMLPPRPADDGWILATNEVVRWNPAVPCTLDVAEFDRFSAEPDGLESAVELYHGDLLEDVYDDWVYPERERLRAAYLSALKTLVYRYRSERAFGKAIGFAQRLLAADPLREDVARELAAARHESGDRAGAVRTLDDFVKRVRAELGVDVMAETQTLREAMLRGEPLNAARSETGGPPPHAERSRSAPAELPFVGREAQLERVGFLWDQAARGHGGIAFVGGEAGIGKTRLTTELSLAAEQQGARVLIGTTTSPESFAYQAFIEALRSSLPLVVASNVERVWLSVLATVIPELQERVAVDPVAALTADEEKTRLFEAVTRTLHALSRARPVLFVLEDLHWCSPATCDLLRFVCNRLFAERIAIIATYRDEEVVRAHPLRALRRELQERGAAMTVDLSRLERESVARIVAHVAGGSGIAERAAELYERSLGNPLFLGELIRDATERARAPLAAGDEPLPTTIEHVITARLVRLDDGARRAVAIASVLGTTFDFELMGEVTGWESSALLDALDQLIEHHLIRETTRRERGAYAFTHHLIRTTAYDELSAEVRRRYHGVVARAIAGMHAAEGDEWASELARHYEGGGERLPAARAWSRAARAALAAYSNDEAVAHATRGLAIEQAALDVPLRASLLSSRAEASDRLGDRTQQRSDVETMVELGRSSGDRDVLREGLRRAIDLAHIVTDDALAVRAIEALASEIEPEEGAWRAALLKARAQLAFDRFDYAAALSACAQAAELYRSCGDARGELDTLLIAIDARSRQDRFDDSRGDVERARELTRNMDDPYAAARFVQSTMMEAVAKQDFPAAYASAGELLALSRASGNRLGEARAYERLATAANRMFAIREAIDGYAKALAIYESIGDRHGSRSINNNWGSLDVFFGCVDRGRERLLRLHAAAAADADPHWLYYAESNLGVAAFVDCDFAAAKAYELRALELARRLGSESRAALVLGDLGAAELELGDLDAALANVEEAAAINRRVGQRLALVENLSRLALIHARRGEFERARAFAAELSAEQRARPELFEDPGETLWRTAQALHAVGDREAASDLLERAAESQAARCAALDVAEYRESYAQLRWYRELLRAKSTGEWP
jgi:DNA-binding SARP family transcriptional activator/tetratricopeptide (TPR) repeat protein